MKLKLIERFYCLLIVILIGPAAIYGQTSLKLDVRNGENKIPLNNVLKNDNGELILEIAEKEIIELLPQNQSTNLVLSSSDQTKVQIINNRLIIGVEKTDSPVNLTGTVGGAQVLLNDHNQIKIKVVKAEVDSKVNSDPTFLSYKVVKDAFGKRIAQYYLVVQVNIQNNNPDKRFLVQDVSVAFDPKQCRKMKNYFSSIDPTNYDGAFDEDDCLKNYKDYFAFPMNISPIERDTILAAANTEKYRSKRYELFKVLRFVADVGAGLTTFKILGRDGIAAMGFLGGTFFNGLDSALPKLAEDKRANLEKSVPQENIIVNANDSKRFNIFIPIDRVFNSTAWNNYKKNIKKSGETSLELRRYLQLFLIASSKGVLIDANSKTTESKGGGAKSVIDRLDQRP